MTREPAPRPPATIVRAFGDWFGAGPRRHGERVQGRAVSYVELFYDLVFVVLVGQAAHALALHPGRAGAVAFGAVFGLIWIAWINGTLYHELHGREDGRSRIYIFAQMCVLAVLAVFVQAAGSTGAVAFSLTYAVLLVLLWWQWFEVRRRDLPEHRDASTPYLVGLAATGSVMVTTAWLPTDARIGVWWCLVTGWVVLGGYGFVSRDRDLEFFAATHSLIERLALFIIIVLGETVVGVVNGIAAADPDALTIVTGVLGLCVGFGVWWNYFDIIGVRAPRAERTRAATWFFAHLPLTAAIAAAGAAMVGLVTHAHATRTPPVVAWTLGAAVAACLALIAVESAMVTRDHRGAGRALPLVLILGAGLVLVLAAVAPPPWLLAFLVVAVLTATWLITLMPSGGVSPLPDGGTDH